MRKVQIFFISFVLLLLSGTNVFAITRSGIIERVIDGDTIKIVDMKENIRLYGIDTPEKKQVGGMEATLFVENFLNKEVEIEFTGKGDKYGRRIAIIYDKETGKSLQELLLLAGHAWVYEVYCKKKYEEPWKDLEFIAMREGKEIWKANDITSPWEWRKEQKKVREQNKKRAIENICSRGNSFSCCFAK